VAYLNNTFGHKPTIDIVSDYGLVELFEKVRKVRI
jgi:Asp-tRNA(Asn)/Glu-tRNA(Gln) amidotransferase A subunit family amidase